MTYRYYDPLIMPASAGAMEVVDDVPERAMVIFAHPDDAEIGTGGTVAKWAQRGCEVTYVQSTSGSSGSNDRSMSSERIVSIRGAEQQAAASVIGAGTIEVLNHADGGLEHGRQYLGELVRLIRKHRPEVVFAHDAYRYAGFQHSDHRAAGLTAMDAIYPYARDHLHFPEHLDEGLEPWKVGLLFLWGADRPDVIVDVTDSLHVKIKALLAHESQVGGLATSVNIETRLRRRSAAVAAGFRFKYGEAFRRLTART